MTRLTEVQQVHERVQDAVAEYEKPGDLVEVDVLVQRQKQRKSAGPEERDAVPQHEDQYESTIEV